MDTPSEHSNGHEDRVLSLSKTAECLTESGYPMDRRLLACLITKGEGPPCERGPGGRFGTTKVSIRWDDALAWAGSRGSAPGGPTLTMIMMDQLAYYIREQWPDLWLRLSHVKGPERHRILTDMTDQALAVMAVYLEGRL